MLDVITLAENQALTAGWVDVGNEFECTKLENVLIWIDIDINDSQDFRIRLLAKTAKGGTDEYFLPIRTVSPTVNRIQQEYIEFTEDIDQKILAESSLDHVIPWMQIQCQAGVAGAAPGIINSLKITVTRGSN